jgi:hypothetical protein
MLENLFKAIDAKRKQPGEATADGPIVWTRNEVMLIIEELQPKLLPHYHAGLWGSVLTKGESRKDFDLIIIPTEQTHNDYDEIKKILTTFGMSHRKNLNPGYVNKHVEVWDYRARRVDVMNMYPNTNIPAFIGPKALLPILPMTYPATVHYVPTTPATDWNAYNGF